MIPASANSVPITPETSVITQSRTFGMIRAMLNEAEYKLLIFVVQVANTITISAGMPRPRLVIDVIRSGSADTRTGKPDSNRITGNPRP